MKVFWLFKVLMEAYVACFYCENWAEKYIKKEQIRDIFPVKLTQRGFYFIGEKQREFSGKLIKYMGVEKEMVVIFAHNFRGFS